MATTEKAVRESIIARGATVVAAGLGGAFVGDISARFKDSLLITPSAASTSRASSLLLPRSETIFVSKVSASVPLASLCPTYLVAARAS